MEIGFLVNSKISELTKNVKRISTHMIEFFFALVLLPFGFEAWPYLAFFLILVVSGIGLPIPEEVTLILGGYLAYLEVIDFWPAVSAMIAGIVVADLLGYMLGRLGIGWMQEYLFNRWRFSAALLGKAQHYFEVHGEKVVAFSRPFLGIRVIVPMLAGHFRMNLIKFIVFDIAAAAPWTILVMTASYYLGSSFDLLTEVREAKHLFFLVIGLAVMAYGVIQFWRGNGTRSMRV